MFEGYCGEGCVRTDRYYTPLPVWCAGNAYLGGARPWEKEKDALVDGAPALLSLREEDGFWTLEAGMSGRLPRRAAGRIDTGRLGEAFEPEQRFENPDGTPIVFDTDWFGRPYGDDPLPGPFADPGSWDGALRL